MTHIVIRNEESGETLLEFEGTWAASSEEAIISVRPANPRPALLTWSGGARVIGDNLSIDNAFEKSHTVWDDMSEEEIAEAVRVGGSPLFHHDPDEEPPEDQPCILLWEEGDSNILAWPGGPEMNMDNSSISYGGGGKLYRNIWTEMATEEEYNMVFEMTGGILHPIFDILFEDNQSTLLGWEE